MRALIKHIATLPAVLMCLFLLMSMKCTSTSNNNKPAATTQDPPRTPITSILTEKEFNDAFPQRDKFYTYAAFVKAVNELGQIKIRVGRRAVSVYQITRTDKSTGKTTIVRQDSDWNENWAKQKPDSIYTVDYGDFCSASDAQTNKKELAAFMAHIAHETRHGENGTYLDGLMLTHEDNTTLAYLGEAEDYKPAPGKKYYGRGPMQISYNGNYGYASDCIFGDHRLLENPDLVETDAVTSFKTAIYFWMTPQTHKPSAHDVMIGKWQPNAIDKAQGRTTPGFGMTIDIVNGEVECNKGENNYSMNDRIGFYQHFLKVLGVSDPNCACSCGKMQPIK